MVKIKKWLLLTVSVLTLGLTSIALLQAPAYASGVPVLPDGGSTAPTQTQGQVTCKTGDACGNFIDEYINPFIILLSGLVGVFAVISIIIAGIQYSSSADDPSKVSKAKQRIFNTVIGLVAYIFLFAFLNYLVPGGLF